MVKRDELHRMSGDHFHRLWDVISEVANEIGDVSAKGVIDYMAVGMNSLRETRACA